MNTSMENGTQMMFAELLQPTCQKPSVGVLASHAKTSVLRENSEGLKETAQACFFRITNILKQLKEEDRPNYLFIENVRNLISINRGYDFARLLVELAECGYDAEWQILNSKHHGVPQNRERIFIIGHFGNRSRSRIFPIEGTGTKNSIKQIGQYTQNSDRGNPSPYRVYSGAGISPCLTANSGGEK